MAHPAADGAGRIDAHCGTLDRGYDPGCAQGPASRPPEPRVQPTGAVSSQSRACTADRCAPCDDRETDGPRQAGAGRKWLAGEGDLKHQALTQRELHVARLAAAGLTNNEIAERTRRVGAHGRVAPLPRLRQSSASPAAASSITNSSSTKTTCWPRVDGQAQGRLAQGFRASFTPRTRHAGVEGGRRDAGDCINDCCTRRS